MITSLVAAAAALVAIHVGPDVPPELSAAAVRSCEIALGEQQCVPDEPQAPAARWQVTVTSPEDGKDAARIDLRQEPASPVLVTREITFLTEDALRERWASIGVLIAALVVARSRDAAEASAEPTPVPRPASPAPPSRSAELVSPRKRASPSAPVPWRLDLHALLSRRLEREPFELGARFRASVLPAGGPWFGLVSIAAASRASTEPRVAWFGTSLGPGFRVGHAATRVAAEFGAGGIAEYWTVGASEPGRSEQAGAFRVGGFGSAEALWAVHQRWILSLGVEGRAAAPRLRLEVAGDTVERIPELGGFIFAGLRFIP